MRNNAKKELQFQHTTSNSTWGCSIGKHLDHARMAYTRCQPHATVKIVYACITDVCQVYLQLLFIHIWHL